MTAERESKRNDAGGPDLMKEEKMDGCGDGVRNPAIFSKHFNTVASANYAVAMVVGRHRGFRVVAVRDRSSGGASGCNELV